MRNRRQSLYIVFCALVGCVALLSVACADRVLAQPKADGDKSARAPAGDGKAARVVIATVNNKPIYQDEIDRAVKVYVGNQTVEPAILPTIQANHLKQRIENEL